MRRLLSALPDEAAASANLREAITFEGQSLTWGEVVECANQIANVLIEQGVQRGDRVGICLYKGMEMILAAYGVMKAGAAYVPLDPTAPAKRLAAIANDCGIEVLISQPDCLRTVRSIATLQKLTTILGIPVDDTIPAKQIDWKTCWESSASSPDVRIIEDDLAYIIYTSGSTGRPKGIVHTHRSGMAFIEWATEVHAINANDRLSNHSPLHFDMSMLEFYGAAYKSATTIIIPEEHKKMPASYSKLLQEERITIFYTVPFALTQLLDRGVLEQRDLSSLRWVIFGGESFSAERVTKLMNAMPNARFSHVYGPTEANACTYFHLPSSDTLSDPMPIGVDCPNGESILVDESGEVVEGEGTGELYLRGPSVMVGYWNRPDLNKEVFATRQTGSGLTNRFLRSGDLVRRGPDGNYYFESRKDRQVKIRGFRIELSEIEQALLVNSEVSNALAFSEEDNNGNPMVVAAVEVGQSNEVSPIHLLQTSQEKLAAYAIPRHIEIFKEFPRTSGGKIDVQSVRSLSRTFLSEAS